MSQRSKSKSSKSAPAALPSSRRRPRHRREEEEEPEDEEEEMVDDEQEEEERAERARRSKGPARNSSGGAAASAASSAAAAASSASASTSKAPYPPTALHQALLRFLTANGRASLTEVQRYFEEAKRHCPGAASKALPLDAAWDHLNQYIRFMELEIRRMKSEVNDQIYWVLVDTNERVAKANAHFQVDADADEEERKNSSHAANDASAMARFLNPTIFNDKQLAYFTNLLDAILAAPTGKILSSDAVSVLRKGPDGKWLFNEDEARFALNLLKQHGWIRDNPNDSNLFDANENPDNSNAAASSSSAAAAVSSSAARRRSRKDDLSHSTVCLGERSYVELKAYVEEKIANSKCRLCKDPCLLGLICVQQSSESKRLSESDDVETARRCPIKMHYHCAKRSYLSTGKIDCPDCGCQWDKFMANAPPVSAAASSARR